MEAQLSRWDIVSPLKAPVVLPLRQGHNTCELPERMSEVVTPFFLSLLADDCWSKRSIGRKLRVIALLCWVSLVYMQTANLNKRVLVGEPFANVRHLPMRGDEDRESDPLLEVKGVSLEWKEKLSRSP
ncbi:hypothetical protein TNCV_3000021 [Trichonephila clavipes]|nr:hypothetical protein TNCV_3000021 [Trichonephila clavipes]